MSEDRAGVEEAVATGRSPDGRGAGSSGATTAALPMSGSVPVTDRHAAPTPAAEGADEPATDLDGAQDGAQDRAQDRVQEQPLGGVRRPVRPGRVERPDADTVPSVGPGPTAAAAAARPPAKSGARRARLALRRVDPVSVFVLSLLISLFLGIVLLVAVGLLYFLLQSAGVLSSLDTFARELSLIQQDATIISAGRVFAVAGIVAAVDVVVITVLATLAAVLYNVCASFTGGIEVTLSERE